MVLGMKLNQENVMCMFIQQDIIILPLQEATLSFVTTFIGIEARPS